MLTLLFQGLFSFLKFSDIYFFGFDAYYLVICFSMRAIDVKLFTNCHACIWLHM